MIDFAGWMMPVQYTSILEEHRAVRERVGLFDLSHMGELFARGTRCRRRPLGRRDRDRPTGRTPSAGRSTP